MSRSILGPRDLAALTWLTQMYGQPMTVVAALLGAELSNAYRIVRRWRAAGMVNDLARPVPGPGWVYPSRQTADALMDAYVRYWVPNPTLAAHHSAVGNLRLALTGADLTRWTSERQLRLEQPKPKAGEKRPRVHDGRYTDDLGKTWAVEVELTVKPPAYRLAAVTNAYEQTRRVGLDGLIYYAANDEIKTVIRKAAKQLDGPGRDGEPKFFIHDLRTLTNQTPADAAETGLSEEATS